MYFSLELLSPLNKRRVTLVPRVSCMFGDMNGSEVGIYTVQPIHWDRGL